MADTMGPLENYKQNRSTFNPMDAASMKQDGTIRPDMTIAEFFQSRYGLDVNTNTIMDLAQAGKKDIENSVPVKKMQNMAGGPGMGQPPAPQPQAGPQGQAGGLRELVNGMR